jgi:thioredoxin reductase
LSIARRDFCKGEAIGDAARADSPFRLLVEDTTGERDEFAEVVIDATGTFAHHNWLGAGGAPAVWETAWRGKIDYGLPDILGEAKPRFENRRTLVIGNGYSAATNVVALAELHGEAASGNVTWITRTRNADHAAPIGRIESDRLPARDELAVKANAFAAEGTVRHLPGASITSIFFDEPSQQFAVQLSTGEEKNEQTFDNIIANVGYRPDASLWEELQVHQCYATGGPMKLAAALLEETSADCLDQTSRGPAALVCPEPNFYVLGSKSYGRNSNFLMSVGLSQVREVFTLIGDREDLDLYATMKQAK